MINVGSGKSAAWTYRSPATPTSLSLSADGSLLGMVSNPSNGTRLSGITYNSAWVLPADAAPGQLGQRYRRVLGSPTWTPVAGALSPTSTVLSPTGAVTFAITIPAAGEKPGQMWRETLRAYDTSTGQPIRVLRVLPRLKYLEDPSLSPDTSGRFALLSGWNDYVQVLDLATGRFTRVPGTADQYVGSVAW